MSFAKKILLTIVCLCLMTGTACAGTIMVACAANFTGPMKQLAALYEQQTGTKVRCTFGSTGMLYGQITKGAPYDLFFAADEKRPATLFEAGLAQKPSLYAKGKSVLWTNDPDLEGLTDWKAAVTSPKVKKVGIANPKTAPYGLRSTEAMTQAGLTADVEPKLVFGKNVGMAFQYAYSGSAQVAFIALSQALSDKGKAGKYWLIPEAGPVHQAACILKKADAKSAAAFLAWLKTKKAQSIITHFGYE